MLCPFGNFLKKRILCGGFEREWGIDEVKMGLSPVGTRKQACKWGKCRSKGSQNRDLDLWSLEVNVSQTIKFTGRIQVFTTFFGSDVAPLRNKGDQWGGSNLSNRVTNTGDEFKSKIFGEK